MASKRLITPFLSSRSIIFAPRATSRVAVRTVCSLSPNQNQPWRVACKADLVARALHVHQFSSASVRCDSSSNEPKSSPPFKQWTFDDISNTLTTPTAIPTILIDVREPKELVSTGIIPTSLSIPLSLQPDAFFLTPDEFLTRFGFAKPMTASNNSEKSVNANIVFYCRAGVRAQTAADFAVQAGYQRERVGVYSGSWLDWEKKGGKVEKWDKKN
ncbi:Thiosulfate sulfurtransferase rdl2, mitochondrial [Ophidiomyces ophidiicola]|uniref:Thiosulfate sulfurtransferase rdl2, mitochondrial n=1 Tax=Ophidiomyces ophidiicola TaxID=1387563 RepID=UPI0020C1C09C|nr:Thiosulfate sulfurtransferase rdl2, mitochondrial [Ophidiomyces ophidiicola]KAI1943198.1 Thiosulfate sulfurtransferase rdl2, mitochondrial [Ophidiomyces ophidiicola]KAI2060631.1 Thiosulfate sulfurtransferase rdl2, mitochondrial [Ophidiomyces ophidiicola]